MLNWWDLQGAALPNNLLVSRSEILWAMHKYFKTFEPSKITSFNVSTSVVKNIRFM